MMLETLDLYKSWALPRPQRGRRQALDGVSLQLAAGERLGIVGESGCGKSTLARVLVGAHPCDSGSILLGGRPLAAWSRVERARQVQMIFQDPAAALHPRLSVRTLLEEPLRYGLGWGRAAITERIQVLLETLRLPVTLLERYPHELSGGQRQRVGIARALAIDPAILICDEPLSSLDRLLQLEVIALLDTWRAQKGKSLILISHDLSLVQHVCDRIAVMYQGRLIETGETAQLFARPWHPYTHQLLQSVPRLYRSRDYPLATAVERDAENGESACGWAVQCSYAEARCRQARPLLQEVPHTGMRVACHRVGELPS